MADKPKRRNAPALRTPKAPRDIAILHGPTDDREGAKLLRFKDGAVYAGEVRPAREGQAVEHHELVRLRPLRPGLPVCEVEVLHAPDARSGAGPARVSSPRYRKNWNAIFGGSATRKGKTGSDWSVN